jgi:hypothetical protein
LIFILYFPSGYAVKQCLRSPGNRTGSTFAQILAIVPPYGQTHHASEIPKFSKHYAVKSTLQHTRRPLPADAALSRPSEKNSVSESDADI